MGLPAGETSDREAIENAWVNYWVVTLPLLKRPPAVWHRTAATVAAEPLLADIMKNAAQFKKDGKDNYGSVKHRFYWGPPVGGEDVAVVGDCMDTSHVGSLNIKTGEKLTVGLVRDNARIGFQRGPDGKWRADHIQYLDSAC